MKSNLECGWLVVPSSTLSGVANEKAQPCGSCCVVCSPFSQKIPAISFYPVLHKFHGQEGPLRRHF